MKITIDSSMYIVHERMLIKQWNLINNRRNNRKTWYVLFALTNFVVEEYDEICYKKTTTTQ